VQLAQATGAGGSGCLQRELMRVGVAVLVLLLLLRLCGGLKVLLLLLRPPLLPPIL